VHSSRHPPSPAHRSFPVTHPPAPLPPCPPAPLPPCPPRRRLHPCGRRLLTTAPPHPQHTRLTCPCATYVCSLAGCPLVWCWYSRHPPTPHTPCLAHAGPPGYPSPCHAHRARGGSPGWRPNHRLLQLVPVHWCVRPCVPCAWKGGATSSVSCESVCVPLALSQRRPLSSCALTPLS
jgi:hypothetical protein